jgi:hypothetical protein
MSAPLTVFPRMPWFARTIPCAAQLIQPIAHRLISSFPSDYQFSRSSVTTRLLGAT